MSNVLITGATRGIGQHLSLHLARRGHRVFATGRRPGALEALIGEARADRLPIEGVTLDVTDRRTIEDAVRTVRERTDGDGIDILINNAGYGQAGPLLEVDDTALREQFEANVFGLMAVTRAFASGMVERGRGCVINVGSTGGRVTFPFFGAYHASKYAVEALSDALRMELMPFGVRVVLIEPGPVRSDFADRAVASLPAPGERPSPYAAVYARAEAIRARADRFAVGPEHVARAVDHAITSRWPRARYLVPAARFELLFALIALAPTCLVDALFRSVFGLGARPIGSAR
jgi:short-subunit dehydrogenase